MGENARQPDAPKFSTTPLEVLTPRLGEGYTFIDKNFLPFGGAVAGALSGVYVNYALKRPVWAGIHQHIILSGLFFFLCKKINEYRLEKRCEEDAILKHYITLHPDDFPPYEPKRYKDLFLPWEPTR